MIMFDDRPAGEVELGTFIARMRERTDADATMLLAVLISLPGKVAKVRCDRSHTLMRARGRVHVVEGYIMKPSPYPSGFGNRVCS